MFSSCIQKLQVLYLWPLSSQNMVGITLNVINLANTLHVLGYCAYLMLDALWFFRWSLRASEMIFKC